MKKVIKIILGVLLALLCAFMFLVRCGKPTQAIKVNASESAIYYYYDASYVSTIIDVDDDYSNNTYFCPKRFFNSSSNIFEDHEDEVISTLYLYDNRQNAFKVDLVIKNMYQSSYGLYLVNNNFTQRLCYYVITQNGGVYSYAPQMEFTLDSSLGGIFTLPNQYTYSFVDVNNSYNFTYSSLLESSLTYLTDNANNFILIGDYSLVDNQAEYYNGYSNGYNDGEQAVINNASNYGLYTQNEYDQYGASEFLRGADSNLTTNGFRVMMSTIFNAPYQILQPILNFELLGVNLWNLFTFIISVIVVMFIIRLIRGGGNNG